jgi:hypothetical protein
LKPRHRLNHSLASAQIYDTALAVPLVISDVAASLYGGPLQSLGWHELRGVGRAIESFSLPEYIT